MEENLNYRETLYKEQSQKCLHVEDTDDCAHDHGFGQKEL